MKTISITFWYGLLSFGFIIILIFEASFATGRLSDLANSRKKVEEETSVLESRLKTLEEVSPTVSSDVTTTTLALPVEEPSLSATSQIRRFALSRLITIKNINSSVSPNSVTSDYGTVQINFTGTGKFSDMVAFIEDITNAAPLLNVDTLNLSTNGDSLIVQAFVNSFWSQLPTKLPSLSEPLVTLSGSELDLLTRLESLSKPVFSENSQAVASESGNAKSDPFTKIQ